ncbi:glucosaminidase domain-containing protein [Paenibacillus silvisoli]|uniref:glucosaminidase domain-containing protein n=1 Tax=Paenibacillus silvisoli TaxID=3110539 RepID=UPI0028052CB5|nr:glucosaminidase domain-containing protein [Paenibacillus silvisoli]
MTRTIGWNVVAYMICAAIVTSLILSFTISNALWNTRSSNIPFLMSSSNKADSSHTLAEPNRGLLFQPATVVPTAHKVTVAAEAEVKAPLKATPAPAVMPKAETSRTYKVTSFYLNVRSEPNASAKILRDVKQGTLLQVMSVTPEGWLSLKGGGYVHGGYADPVPATTDASVKSTQPAAPPISISNSATTDYIKAAKTEVSAASAPAVTVSKAVQAKQIDALPIKPKAAVTSIAVKPSKPVRPTSKVSSDSGLNADHIATILKGTKLAGQGLESVILSIEDKYGINAFFTIAVMKLESGNGKSKLARTKNNLFGLNAVTGKSAYTKAFTFKTKGDSVRKFGQLLSDNYVERGLTTIEKVARKYCPANGRWSGLVRSIMRSDYGKLT